MSDFQKTWLFILPWEIHHPGGVNQVVANIFDEMHRHNDYRPMLLVSDWNAKKPVARVIDNRATINFRHYDVLSKKGSIKVFLSYFFHLPFWLKDAYSIIVDNNISVINAHFPTLSILSWVILKKLGFYKGEIFLSLHGLDVRDAAACKGWNKLAWVFLFNNVNKVVACADGLKYEVSQSFDLKEGSICTVHNGVDVNKSKSKISDSFPFKKISKKFILNIGTFEYKKGQDILLSSFKDIAEKNKNIDLVLVGRSGETSESIKEMVFKLGLTSRVHIFENLPHENTLALFNKCLFFVLPSRNEAFAIVLLEAGAFGKAVIATDICGVNELIEDGSSGYIVASEDISDLRIKILTLINDQDLINKFGQALNEIVLKQFSWEKTYYDYLKMVKG